MIRDLKYPDDAEKVIDSLHVGLKYDAAIAVSGNALHSIPLEGEGPDLSTGVRYGGRAQDEAVRKDAPGLLSRFSLISMVSRLEVQAQTLLLQRRVLEELRGSHKRMNPDAMWAILKRVQKESRTGPVKLCSELIVENPSEALRVRMRWLDGVYRVRNCLAHRLGVVQMVDVKRPGTSLEDTTQEDRLKVVWLRLKAAVNGQEIQGFPFKMGHKLEVFFDEYEREWKVGDIIQIKPTECQAIAMSLSFLGNQLLQDFLGEMNGVLGIS